MPRFTVSTLARTARDFDVHARDAAAAADRVRDLLENDAAVTSFEIVTTTEQQGEPDAV